MKAKTSLGKQEIRSVERRYLYHCRHSAKSCFPTQNFSEIGQSAVQCSVIAKERFSMRQPSVIFNSKSFYLVQWLNCLLLLYEIVHEVHKKKEGRKKLNYDVQTYSISATISNGQKSDGDCGSLDVLRMKIYVRFIRRHFP